MAKKKMTAAQKQAFADRMAQARGKKKTPAAKKPKPEAPGRDATDQELEDIANGIGKGGKEKKPRQRPELDPDPERKYPKVEVGTWPERQKKFGKLVDDAFKLKHGNKPVGHGEERAGNNNKNERIESAKPSAPNLN